MENAVAVVWHTNALFRHRGKIGKLRPLPRVKLYTYTGNSRMLCQGRRKGRLLLFRKNEKNVLRFCNKKAKEKRRLQRVKKPM